MIEVSGRKTLPNLSAILAGLLVAAVVACSPGGDDQPSTAPDGDQPDLELPPVDPEPGSVSGVSRIETEIAFGGESRRVLFLRPVGSGSTLAPALVILHYAGGDADAINTVTAAESLVRDTGVWVILPEARGRSWSFDPVRDRNGPDDVGFLNRVIDQAIASYPLNARRIYMTGFSAGGFMTMRYVCEQPERIAAAAYVSSTLLNTLRENCNPRLPTPVLAMHGSRDRRVPYNQGLGLASAPDSARFFAFQNGCSTVPVRSELPDLAADGTTVSLDSFSSCASNDPVRFYTINNGGHTWPGNDVQVGLLGRTTQDIDATRAIWDFVRGYQR